MKFKLLTAVLFGLAVTTTMATTFSSQAETTHDGTVQRVWEDGFQLNTGDRVFRVDSWDVYGDNTAQEIGVGDRVTVTGEFDAREFDAFSIVKLTSQQPSP